MIVASLVPSITLMTSNTPITYAASSNPKDFMNMTEEQRVESAKNMTQKEKEARDD